MVKKLSFSKEVQELLKHYVYRLVDPRNNETFYVGEGCGNRVFAHVNSVNGFLEEEYPHINKDSGKIKRIKSIINAGYSVKHIIQRWGMNQEMAFEVESAFIDYFEDTLTNKVKGHNHDRGMMIAEDLEKTFNAPVFEEGPNCPKFILIKIKDSSLLKHNNDPYETARGNWRLNVKKANKYPYVLAVRYGIVVGVYKVDNKGWYKSSSSNRYCFDKAEIDKEIEGIFIDKKIPERYKKTQNPISYAK